MVLSIFAGVYYPVSTLPAALRAFARLIPPSYVFETCRAVLAAGGRPADFASNLLLGAFLSVLYLLATSLLFVRVYRKNLATGSIARFNAEAL
jgi:ABC-2 type transport system permease protein